MQGRGFGEPFAWPLGLCAQPVLAVMVRGAGRALVTIVSCVYLCLTKFVDNIRGVQPLMAGLILFCMVLGHVCVRPAVRAGAESTP